MAFRCYGREYCGAEDCIRCHPENFKRDRGSGQRVYVNYDEKELDDETLEDDETEEDRAPDAAFGQEAEKILSGRGDR